MAPPELGSLSEDSQPETGPLEYIEQSLKTLEQNTLKIKKRNDEIIKGIQRPNSVSYSSSSQHGWKGSPIDVPPPIPSTIPHKPSHLHLNRASRALLNVDVEKILAESSKLKDKISETLRQSEKNREENQKYLEELRKESRQLANLPSVGSLVSSPTTLGTAPPYTMGHNGGILSSLKTAFKKISRESTTSTSLKARDKEGKAIHLHLLAPVTETNSDVSLRVPIQLIPKSFEENDSMLPPSIKPRIKRPPPPRSNEPLIATSVQLVDPQPRPRIRRPQMPPPPKPPRAVAPSILQLEDFKNMYENQSVASDDETTSIIQTPIPKPRATIQRQESSESSSESEFVYIAAPLMIKTVSDLDDSDDPLPTAEPNAPMNEPEVAIPVKPTRFQKNSQSTIPVPKHYKKQSSEELGMEKTQAEFHVPLLFPPKRLKKMRSASPPPPTQITSRKIFSGGSVTLSYLSEEETGTSFSSNENLSTLKLQDSPFDEKVGFPQSEHASRTSALRLGVSVEPIDVPVRPWVEPEISTNQNIRASPFHFPEVNSLRERTQTEEESSCIVTEEKALNNRDLELLEMDKKIQDEFSFLDEVNVNVNYNDASYTEKAGDDEDVSPLILEKTCRYHFLADTVTESRDEIYANIESPSRIHPKFEDIEEFTVLKEAPDDQVPPPIINLSPIEPLSVDCARCDSPSPPPPFIPPCPSFPPPPPPMQPFIDMKEKDTSFSSLLVLPLDDRKFEGTVFHALEPVNLDWSQLDKDFIQDNFMTAQSPENEKRRLSLACKQNKLESEDVDPINLLSLKLKQAIEIGSRKIKEENSIIVDSVKTMNPKNMNTDDVQVLLQMIPKENEGITFAKLDDKQCSTLPEGYKIMKDLVKIPRLCQKLNGLNFLLNFDDAIKCIELRTQTLQTAMHSVKNSENFVKIIRVVLAVVNQFGKEIKGFQIQSLERLARKKSSKSGVPLLNYIVKEVGERMPEALDFYQDFQCIEEASKISLTEVRTVLKELRDEINNVQKEILATEQDSVDEIEIRSSLKRSSSYAENIAAQLQEICEQWGNAVQCLKELSEFFGMFNTHEQELVGFFHTIQHFVADFKQALLANGKFFAPVVESVVVCSDSAVKMRKKKSLPVVPNDTGSTDVRMKRRQSLGPTTCQILQNLGEESGQPKEFVDALTIFGTATRSPPPRKIETDGDNRRKRKFRNSQNFGNIEIHYERERP